MAKQLSKRQRARLYNAAQRQFAAQIAVFQPAVHRALGRYVTACARRLATAALPTIQTAPAEVALAASGPVANQQPGQSGAFTMDDAIAMLAVLGDSSDEWDAVLATDILPELEQMLAALPVGLDLSDPKMASTIDAWRAQWYADREIALSGIPDDVTRQLRTELERLAREEGTNVYDAKMAAQRMLDAGYPSWQGRAELIARTEVMSANNMAAYAYWMQLAIDAGMVGTATKTWIGGTRPTHAAVDGTTIDIAGKFIVGGMEMDGPGDSAGGPGECCNCMCTMSYEMTGNADDTGQELTAAAADGGHTGVAILLQLSERDGTRIAQPGGELPEAMHITLGYLAQPADQVDAATRGDLELKLGDAATGAMPLAATAFAIAQFNPGKIDPTRDDCAVLICQSNALAELHERVQGAIAAVEGTDPSTTFPIWIPHVTLGYGLDPATVPADALGTLTFDRLTIGWGEDVSEIVPGPAVAELPDGSSQTGTDPEGDTVTATRAQLRNMYTGSDSGAGETMAATPPPPASVDSTAPAPDSPAPAAEADPQEPAESTGPTWSGPIAELDVFSSDGRMIRAGGGIIRPLPLPLSWQEKSEQGHDGSIIVGRHLAVEDRGDMLWAHGDYLSPMTVWEVEKARSQVDAGLGMISVDIAPLDVSFADINTGQPIDPATYGGEWEDIGVVFEQWEFGGATIVSFQAYANARIANDQPPEDGDSGIGGPFIMPGEIATFAGLNPEGNVLAPDGTSITLTDGTVIEVGDTVTIPDQDGDGTTDTGTITAIDPAAQTVDVQVNPDGDGDTDDDPNNPLTVTVPIADLVPAAPDQEPPGGVDTGMAASLAAAGISLAEGDTDSDLALLAASYSQPYNAAFFKKRELLGPTPLHINRETGEVFGHFAQWGQCHIGKLSQGICATPPETKTGYSYFHLRPVQTDGGPVQVGFITVGTGHANGRAGFRGAVEHYDHTGTQVVAIRAYEDDYGGQFAGQLIPGVDPRKVDELERAGVVSGDWRMMETADGSLNLELCAVLAVNVPGFPIRTEVGLVAGAQMSLVAAGVVHPEEHPDVILPSGIKVPRRDWDSMVAAAVEAIDRGKAREQAKAAAALPVTDQLALARARARLRLQTTSTRRRAAV